MNSSFISLRSQYFLKITLSLSFLFCGFKSLAQEEFSHPFFLSQSGSGGASLREDMSYLLNPATIAFQKKMKGAVSYSFRDNQQTALASFLDLQTKIPLAVTYQRSWTDSFIKKGKNKVVFSSGFKISPFFSLGLNVKRDLKPSLWNAGLGSLFKLSPNLSLALFMDNILKEDENQRVVTLAFYHRWKNFFSTQLDASKSAEKKWIFKGAVQSLFHPLFSLQLGGLIYFSEHDFQKIGQELLSGGISFHSPKILLEYGIQSNWKIHQHSLTLLLRI